MKCCSQFQQIIQMSLLPLFLKGHDFYPPSELCVFHQALWSEIHLSQVFTQRFDTSDIKQARNINSEHKTVYIMTCSLHVYLLLKFLSILNCLHFTLASCIEQNTFCKIFSNSSFSVHQKTFRQINVDFTPLVIQ